ncbi:STAS domain-containing protein [Streptomyces sp. NPDC056468]|uniref:STAS domain-containing protein n=1 Tax=unclassified Streptomyces TaxID=2593676 RepID=UPI00367E23BB
MAEQAMTGTEPTGQLGQLSVTTTAVDDRIRVVTVTGEIDQQTSQPLQQALDATPPAPSLVVVDMSSVSFMDSTGINIFIAAHRSLAADGGGLRLAALTDPVLRTVRLVGVDTFIDCHLTVEQALNGGHPHPQ